MSDYTQGFKDGFVAGLEEGKKIIREQWLQERIREAEKSAPVPTKWPWTQPLTFSADSCPKCGIKISGLMNYTCSSVNCPTFYTATSSVGEGAVGSAVDYTPGYNAPVDYSMR